MRLRWVPLVLLPFNFILLAEAETIVDVSKEWNEHASTTPVLSVPVSSSPAKVADVLPEPSCGCESLTVPERLADSTYAFTGQVLEIQKSKNGKETIVFDVDEIFKGTPPLEMKVIQDLSGTACDLPFELYQSYLVYTKWEWGSFLTSRCMGTKLLEKTKKDALGPSQELKEKLYVRLRNACMGRLDTTCCLSSLKSMRENYNVPEPEGGCPEGTKPDRLRCGGSYTWCIPVTEKDHRQP